MDQKTDTNNIDLLMKEGFRLYSQCKDLEAIAVYQKVIDLDPNHIPAYLQKAFLLERQSGSDQAKAAIECCKMAESKNSSSAAVHACTALRLYLERKYNEVFQAFDKAISTDQKDPTYCVLKGFYLMLRSKYEEAQKTLDQAIQLDSNNVLAHTFKGFVLGNINLFDEMMKSYEKAISIDPNFLPTYLYKSNGMHLFSRSKEGIEAAEICLRSNPEHIGALTAKGNCLNRDNKFEETLAIRKKCCELNPSSVFLLSGYATCLKLMGRLEESLAQYNKVLSLEPNYILSLCKRGEILNQLGRVEEAIKDFIRARELLKSGEGYGTLTSSNTLFINGLLAKVEELEKTAKQTSAQIEEVTKNYDKANPVVSKFIENLKKLDQDKNKTAAKVFGCFSNNNNETKAAVEKEIDELKQQYVDLKKQFEQEVKEIKVNAKKMEEKIEQIQKDISSIKDELETKMDNYTKKLDKELARLDLPSEDVTKLKDYFNAFVGTFSSLYVTAQVVDSGQVSLDASSNKATVLSALASFAPFVGSFLSSSIKSLGEFLESREMKSNARKMKNLASDSTELSQLVGSVAYKVATNTTKQQQILRISAQDLKNKADGMFAKILEFCQNIGEEADAVLYGKLYKTPSAQLGHQDANTIIERWLKLSIGAMETEDTFVKIALGEEATVPNEKVSSTKGASPGRSACCSLF